MPEEFEGDLAGAVFWGADLSGARFRDVNLTDAKISHAWLVNVDIDALVDKVVINGVDVTALRERARPVVPAAGDAPPVEPGGHARHVGGARRRVGEDDRPGASAPRRRAARVGRRRVVLRPDAAPSRVRDGQVVHGADPRRELPPDRAAEHRLRRLPVARPRLRPDAVGLGGARRARRSRRRAFATTSRRLRRPTSPDRSTCSRTARTRCRNASTPSSRKSSGTTATRCATSPSWKRQSQDSPAGSSVAIRPAGPHRLVRRRPRGAGRRARCAGRTPRSGRRPAGAGWHGDRRVRDVDELVEPAVGQGRASRSRDRSTAPSHSA